MTDKPVRIQRQRTKGWRMPPNTVYVGRPSRWGNSYQPGALTARPGIGGFVRPTEVDECVALYREDIERLVQAAPDALKSLRGKNLACWCPLDQPCHADVLLEIANHDR